MVEGAWQRRKERDKIATPTTLGGMPEYCELDRIPRITLAVFYQGTTSLCSVCIMGARVGCFFTRPSRFIIANSPPCGLDNRTHALE